MTVLFSNPLTGTSLSIDDDIYIVKCVLPSLHIDLTATHHRYSTGLAHFIELVHHMTPIIEEYLNRDRLSIEALCMLQPHPELN